MSAFETKRFAAKVLCLVGSLFIVMSPNAFAAGNGNSDPGESIPSQIEALRMDVDALTVLLMPGEITVSVDCDEGDSLADALQTPASQLTVELTGTCSEDLVISRGNLSIEGAGGATIQGSVEVTQNEESSSFGTVRLADISINSSSTTGLFIQRGRSVVAENLTVSDSVNYGIAVVRNSSLECDKCDVTGSGLAGLIISTSSSVVLEGDNIFSDNMTFGVIALGSSSITADEANGSYSITANGNGESGIIVISGSGIFLGNTTSASTLTANGNGTVAFGPGLFIATGGSGHVYTDTLTDGNNGAGVAVWAGTLFMAGNLVSTNHSFLGVGFAGAAVAENGTLRLVGNVEMSDNTFGVWARSSFVSFNTGDITGNLVKDLSLNAGSTVFFPGGGLDLDTVQCDGTEAIVGPNPNGYACDP